MCQIVSLLHSYSLSITSTEFHRSQGHVNGSQLQRKDKKTTFSHLSLLWIPRSFHCYLSCSTKSLGQAVDARRLADHLSKKKSPCLLLPATLFHENNSLSLCVMIDSGYEQNLINSTFIKWMSIVGRNNSLNNLSLEALLNYV